MRHGQAQGRGCEEAGQRSDLEPGAPHGEQTTWPTSRCVVTPVDLRHRGADRDGGSRTPISGSITTVPSVGGDNPWELVTQRPGPGRWMKVVTNIYRMPDGAEVEWDLLVAPDAVAVVALTVLQDVVLARQYRPGPDCFLDELPGGNVGGGETPVEAASRELQEETGYVGEVVIVGHTWQGATITRRKWAAVATGCRRSLSHPWIPRKSSARRSFVHSPSSIRHLRSGQLTDAWAGYAALDHLGLLGPPPR